MHRRRAARQRQSHGLGAARQSKTAGEWDTLDLPDCVNVMNLTTAEGTIVAEEGPGWSGEGLSVSKSM